MSDSLPRLLWLPLLASCAPASQPDEVMATLLPFGSEGEPLLEPSQVLGFDRVGDHLFADLDPAFRQIGIHPAQTHLPVRAQAPFFVRDAISGLSIHARLDEALDVPAIPSQGHVVYADVLPDGADAVLRVTVDGLEDYVLFEDPPATPAVSYTVSLGDAVAGLRFVAHSLEFLDAGGAPRLRVPSPFLVDAHNRVHPATLEVEGCAVQTRPVAPWGREVLPPGARECTLVIAWDNAPVAWPAVLDPGWKTTGSMSAPRAGHTSTLLNDRTVLVAGGVDLEDSPYHPIAELYDPETDTWAETGDLSVNRSGHTATLIGSWGVLVAGGFAEVDPEKGIRAERYDPSDGVWDDVGPMIRWRAHHTATLLLDERVLVAGGDVATIWPDTEPSSSAEIYDTLKMEWAVTGSMAVPRTGHDAGVLLDGRVLVAGGDASSTFTEAYNPSLGSWRSAGDLNTPRSSSTLTVLADGDAIVVGGDATGATSELYDAKTSTWTPAGEVPGFEACTGAGLTGHTANLLADYRVLVAGGVCGDDPLKTSALYDPFESAWQPVYGFTFPRFDHATSLLRDERLLASGGVSLALIGNPPPQEYTTTADILTPCVDDDIDGDRDGTICADDCDDQDNSRFPGNKELCDGLDNDCDGEVPADEVDVDADGWLLCNDCDDRDATFHPEAEELCDGLDNDCDGVVPDDEIDDDGDWWTECMGDCDDTNPDVHPGRDEVWGNGIDDNCDGYADPGYVPDDEEEGCSCTQGPRSGGWLGWILGALGLVFLRRRACAGDRRRTG
ncbi:MAG: hypothetical protein JXB39_13305 [Deltaproteobacteria bacterium]|nr:hypothetical protein [Deltaproteobacteria bacterium]